MMIDKNIDLSINWISENVLKLNPANSQSNIPFSIQTKAFFELIVILYMLQKRNERIKENILFNNILQKMNNIDANDLIDFIFSNREHTRNFYTGLLYWHGLFPNNKEVKNAVDKAYANNLFSISNQPPYRQYENNTLLHLLNIKPFSEIDQKELLKYTILYSDTIDLFSVSRLDQYELTHMIFYITNFGVLKDFSKIISKNRLQIIKQYLLFFISKSILDKNYDLLAEHIYCYILLMHKEEAEPELISEGINIILSIRRPTDGVIESAPYTLNNIKSILKQTQCDDNEIDVVLHYHPTLVFILVYFTYLNS